jgi:hypothetical protein
MAHVWNLISQWLLKTCTILEIKIHCMLQCPLSQEDNTILYLFSACIYCHFNSSLSLSKPLSASFDSRLCVSLTGRSTGRRWAQNQVWWRSLDNHHQHQSNLFRGFSTEIVLHSHAIGSRRMIEFFYQGIISTSVAESEAGRQEIHHSCYFDALMLYYVRFPFNFGFSLWARNRALRLSVVVNTLQYRPKQLEVFPISTQPLHNHTLKERENKTSRTL